jgi:glycosyltransferase involved in cell wall biosynthesis
MRFVAEKDPALWIDTAAEIAKARPQVRFLIAGFGPLEDTIKARIDALGLRDRVALAGPVDDAGLIYCAADVVLLTSAIEGIPNVMIEAQAVGRPVVAPDVGGAREAVADGRTGTIVRPRTADALARAAVTLLDDVAWRERVRIEGPQFVAARFDLDRMVEETIAFYGSGRKARAGHGTPGGY